MPKRVISLTDTQVKNAKPKDKVYRLTDGNGLYLLVTPMGGKLWRFDYRVNGRRNTLAFKTYPEISLSDARQLRDEARKLTAKGIDPSEAKKEHKAQQIISETTFEKIAREWFDKQLPKWSKGHADTVISRLQRDVFPFVGNRPISEIKTAEMREVILRIDSRGAIDTALRVKIICGQIFRYAVMSGVAESDLMASLKPKELLTQKEKKHHAAITDPKELPPLLRAIDDYHGSISVKAALQLAPLVFVRPGKELIEAEWTEIDFEEAVWNIPAERMKMKKPHVVPLSTQAVAILKNLYRFTGGGKCIFAGRTSSRPISNNTINAALRYMGFDKDTMTGHGFRATARTILDEILNVRPDYIEHQLAHAVKDPNGRAYNRTAHLAERRKMMQLWADYLEGLKAEETQIKHNNK